MKTERPRWRTETQHCPSCGTRITYDDGEMVDAMPADEPCPGCLLLLPILDESARRRAALPPPPEPEMALTASAIEARLRGGHVAKPEHDWAKAAAGDRE